MASCLYLSTAALVAATLIEPALFQQNDQLTFTASSGRQLTKMANATSPPLLSIHVSSRNSEQTSSEDPVLKFFMRANLTAESDQHVVSVAKGLWTFLKGLNLSWLVLFLSLFAVVGFIGNLLVCLAISFDPKLQNATNYYLFSLAVADLLVSVVVIPLAIIKNFYREFQVEMLWPHLAAGLTESPLFCQKPGFLAPLFAHFGFSPTFFSAHQAFSYSVSYHA